MVVSVKPVDGIFGHCCESAVSHKLGPPADNPDQ